MKDVSTAMPSGSDLEPRGGAEAIDPQWVDRLSAELERGSLQDLHHFGRELGQETARFADSLLEQVHGSDLELIGDRLQQIIIVAKSLNLGVLSEHRSRIPLLGGLVDRLRMKRSEIAVRFQDVRTQVDGLLAEVDTMQQGLAQRIDMLEQAFESIRHEHMLLGAHVVAGERVLGGLSLRVAAEVAQALADPMRAQALQDLRSAMAVLEKRVADLRMLQHAALQQLPMIRLVQANNRMLIEKFHTIRELTVPAWKRQFTLALSLGEQQQAVALANRIDDATNEFLRENARLLKDNTIATARANQRAVIDLATLQEVHQSLMSTVEEVVRINREGEMQRAAASVELQAMRDQLSHRIGAD